MKQTQRDIKYIIKRILIGVGITLILFNLKKCDVYAATKDYYIWCNATSSNQVCMANYEIVSNLSHLGETIQTESDTYNFYSSSLDFGNIIFKNEETGYIYVFTIIKNTNLDISNYKKISFGMPLTDSINNVTMQFPTIAYVYGDNDTLLYNMQAITNQNDGLYPWSQVYRIYEIDNNNNVGLITKANFTTLLRNNKLTYVGSNYDDIELSFGDTPFYTPTTDPLANYTQLDLTGYEGVLLVPKDYQIMQENFSRTEQPVPGTFITYLDLDFYSEKCIRSTLINLTNVNDLMTNNIGTSVGGLAGSISGTCTDEPFQTILSYRYDMLSGMIPMGIMVYNNEIITGTYNNGFGTSYVWYNPTYYDYYLIESVADFNETISFTDFDGTEKDLHVEKIPNFEEMANYVLEHSEDLDKGKINSILGYSKITIPFLNKLKLYSCEAIRMPFPWSNSIMIMPCMSTLYNNVIPTAMIGVISVIINGLLIYRAIMSIIGTYLDLARPDTTKLEVIDL